MVEPHVPQAGPGYVSLDLAARVAGIPLAEMQRIAAGFAKGGTAPWFDAVLKVRTERVLGRRHRDIAVPSLPEWMRDALSTNRFRFRLAAEQVEPGAELRPDDFLLLHRAVASEACPANHLPCALDALCGGRPLVAAAREDFDCLMDHFYGWGFRDDALPGVSADYLDFLDRSRRHLGMSDRYYGAVLAELGGVDLPRRLDGAGFIRVADYMLRLGLPWTLPERAGMDRTAAGMVNEARSQLGIDQDQHERNLIHVAGDVLRTRDLDAHGFYRLHAASLKAGYRMRVPAPRVPAEPGYVTQPQANLIWRLWQNIGGLDGDTSAASLDRWLGYAGGLACLTAAGAGKLIGDWLAPAIERRRAADAARREGRAREWKTPACSEQAVMAAEGPAGTERPKVLEGEIEAPEAIPGPSCMRGGTAMTPESTENTDLSQFARALGLPETADEAAIVAAIERRERVLVREALGLTQDAGLNACLERIASLRDNEIKLVFFQLDALGRMNVRLREFAVKEIMQDAIREARDTLDP